MRICVYGSLAEPVRNAWHSQAVEFGRQLAQRGHVFLFGGGGTGILGTAAAAAQAASGQLLAVVRKDSCWETPLRGVYPRVTVSGYRTRKQTMEEMADGFVILPGGIGTLDECVETLILESRYKPVVLYQPDGYYEELRQFFRRASAEGLLSSDWNPDRWFCDNLVQVWMTLEGK
jgi:uncharacterized protein (TIGR00730 family)